MPVRQALVIICASLLPRSRKLLPYAAKQYLVTASICASSWAKAKLSLIFTELLIICAHFSLQSWSMSSSW